MSTPASSPRARNQDDYRDLPFKELKAKEYNHLQLTNATMNFSWWLFNLKSQVIQTHSSYECVFNNVDDPAYFQYQQSFSRLLHTFVIVADAAANHPAIPGFEGHL